MKQSQFRLLRLRPVLAQSILQLPDTCENAVDVAAHLI